MGALCPSCGSCKADTRRLTDRGKITLLSVRATPCGFQPQHRAALAGRSYGSTPAAATIHGRSFLFVTHPDWWSRAWSVVTLSTFVFYTHPRRTLLNGLRKVGQDGIGSSHGVQADSRLSSHDRCLRTTGRGSHRSAGERLQIGLRRQRLLPSQLHARLGHGGPGLF